MKAGDKVIVIEADTHTDLTRPFIGYTGEVYNVYYNACSVAFGDRVIVLFNNEVIPAKEYQVLQILRQWKRSLK